MSDEPFERRPGNGEHDPERYRWDREPNPHDEPEHGAREQAEHGDGREVPERRERREMPQRDDHPVEHERVADEAVPPAPPKSYAWVCLEDRLADEQHGRRDREKAEKWKRERRVAGR